jgi:hypothetical protein
MACSRENFTFMCIVNLFSKTYILRPKLVAPDKYFLVTLVAMCNTKTKTKSLCNWRSVSTPFMGLRPWPSQHCLLVASTVTSGQVERVTAEFSVDLGNDLRYGKRTVLCLRPVPGVDFRLPQLCWWDLRSCGILRSVVWWLFTTRLRVISQKSADLSNRLIPAKNTFDWRAVVFYECQIVELFSVVFYVVRVTHKFDFRFVINKNKLRHAVIKTRVIDMIYMFFLYSRRECEGTQPTLCRSNGLSWAKDGMLFVEKFAQCVLQ